MRHVIPLLIALACAGHPGAPAFAQEPQVTGDQDGSSQQVEESDEAYRRRMELEDARYRDPTFTDTANSYRRDLEKIDKLPQESRENIRDQLVDVIMENPDWEPGDALQEYPYEPTAAAQADPELLQQEQEAWAEQIEKYHAREAEAFGAYRGPVPGPGNPRGQEGGQQGGEGEQQGQQGQQGQAGGQQGSQGTGSESGTAGTYQPYASQSGSSEEAVSTEGVSESALDFLMGRQAGGQQAGSPGGTPGSQDAQPGAAAQQQAQAGNPPGQPGEPQQEAAEQADSEQAQSSQQAAADEAQSPREAADPDMRGIIAIRDLDKLEGTGAGMIVVEPPEEEDQPGDDRDGG